MRILKYCLVIATACFLSMMASAEEKCPLETDQCGAPCMNSEREIIMNCIFINGLAYEGKLKPKGMDEWAFEVEFEVEVEKVDRYPFEEVEIEPFSEKPSCNKDFEIDNCVTVSGSFEQFKKGNSDTEFFMKLPSLMYEDEKTYQQAIVLEFKERIPVQKKISDGTTNNGSSDRDDKYEYHFNVAKNLTYQSGVSKSYGTLKPFPDTGEKLPALPVDTIKKKLLAIYMVGSDLEMVGSDLEQEGLATKDLIELVKGYDSLNNKDEIDVVVAYGGSIKEIPKEGDTGTDGKCPLNWKGVKFTKFLSSSLGNEENKDNDEKKKNCTSLKEILLKEKEKEILLKETLLKSTLLTAAEKNFLKSTLLTVAELLKSTLLTAEKKKILKSTLTTVEKDVYLYTEPRANMGDKSTLKHFLNYLKEDPLFEEHESRILVFWGHGGSYRGFGNDQVYSMDGLSLTEIQEAFEEVLEKEKEKRIFDLIGFDACLMGSVEVADVLSPYTKYLLASEDLEPGEGWNWENVIRYADTSHDDRNSDANIERFARAVIDDFSSKDDDIPGGFGKTLSVVDLGKLRTVKDKFNAVASTAAIALSTPLELISEPLDRQETEELRKAFFKAMIEASAYGKKRDQRRLKTDRVAIDWKNFAQIAKENTNKGSAIEELNAFIRALDEYIVYSSHNDKYANGVSFGGLEETAPQLSGAADDLRKAFLAIKNDDEESPEPVSVPREANAKELFEVPYIQGGIFAGKKPRSVKQSEMLPFLRGERANFTHRDKSNLRSLLSLDDVRGIAAKFKDDVYIARVTTLFAKKSDHRNDSYQVINDSYQVINDSYQVINDSYNDSYQVINDSYQVIAELEAYPTKFEDLYFTPYWNQQWYTVKYGVEEEDYKEIPLAFQYRYLGADGEWYTYYSTKIAFVDASLKDIVPDEQLNTFKTRLGAITNEFDSIKEKFINSGFNYYDEEKGSKWSCYDGQRDCIYDDDSKSYDIVMEYKDEYWNVWGTVKDYQVNFYDNENRISYKKFAEKEDYKINLAGEKWSYNGPYNGPYNEGNWQYPVKNGRLDLIVDSSGKVRGHTVRVHKNLVSEGSNEEFALFDKNAYKIETGDIVTFYADLVSRSYDSTIGSHTGPYEKSSNAEKLITVEFTKKPELDSFKIKKLEDKDYYVAMRAEDLNGKTVQTKFFKVPPSPKASKDDTQDEPNAFSPDKCQPNC